MKKTKIILTALVGVFFASCEEADVQVNDPKTINAKAQSSVFDYVQAMKLENGIQCENNILIFPSWDLYNSTIDKLDEITEEYCDAFDANVSPNLTDDEYDAVCDAQGFDEDNIIIQFENDLKFCSLRKKIEAQEDQWLGLQGDGQWNIANDPDNHFIEDETERALLSVNAEVIIGDKKNGYTYYKFTDDRGGAIIVYNSDIPAMTQVSSGVVPTNNPNVKVVTAGKLDTPTASCKGEIKESEYIVNGGDRLKRKNKIRNTSPWSAKRIVAVTIGYKKKNGKWKRRRTWITSGITNSTANGNGIYKIDCSGSFDVNKIKNKKRRRVKSKERLHSSNGNTNVKITTTSNLIFALHRKGNIDFKKDYYVMQPN